MIEDWCRDNNIYVSIICDTIGLQGVKIYERNRKNVESLLENLSKIIEENEIFVEMQKVRGGHILAFSLKALTESEIRALVETDGKEFAMSFKDRINNAFVKPLKTILINSKEPPKSLEDTAFKIVEDSFKDATEGGTRANYGGHRNSRNLERSVSTVLPKHKHRLHGKKKFTRDLTEALEGMATPDGEQPVDLFKKFGKALTVLGNEMGIGPLQDHLKKQGINYKKSDDNQSIIMYVMNAQTNAPQPIARISAETLAKPNEFQDALLNMIDFSQGKAPGAFKQQQEQLRAQEKVVRDISQAVNPDNQIADKLSGQQAASPQPVAAKPSSPAETQAATQAATPKI